MKKLLSILVLSIFAMSLLLTVACNKTPCEHNVEEYLTDTSTCVSKGLATGKCTKCGETVTVEIQAHHRYDEDNVCTICGYERWDGTYIPEISQLGEYAQRYLPNIQADSYVDFAKTIDIDLNEHPDLYDSGIFWCYYDEEAGIVKEVSMRDTEKIDELIEKGYIDGSKPTTIFTHGLGVDTYQKVYDSEGEEVMCCNIYDAAPNVLDPNDPTYADYIEESSGKVNLNLVYLKNGYNVINFSYRRFADESGINKKVVQSDGKEYDMGYANNMVTEAKVYSTVGPTGMRYRYESGNFSDGKLSDGSSDANDNETAVVRPDLDFTIAEYYAAEYVRMVNYMVGKGVFDENFTIQCSGHSMGGVVTVVGNYLVSELIRVGQIPSYYLADRIILGDSYLGVYTNYKENVPDYKDLETDSQKTALQMAQLVHLGGVKVHWTGKTLDGCGSFGTYITALYQLSKVYNVPCEYYVDLSFSYFASLPAANVRHLVWSLCATQIYNIKYNCNTHNAIREYRVANIIEGLTSKTADGTIAVCSTLSDDEIRARTGKIYYQVRGNNTPTLSDDVFEIRTIEEMKK